MAYITTTHLSDRLGATLYGRLTDRVNGTTPSATVAEQIVDEAEAEANSYLAQRYATPVSLAGHPELVALLEARVLDLAEFIAWKGSPFISDPPQRIRTVQQSALQWFEAVARGAMVLPAAPQPAPTAARDDGPYYRAAPRLFTADELGTLQPAAALLGDLEMERVIYTADRARTNWLLLAGQPDRMIRVLQVLASCWEDLSVALVGDPEGTPTPLSEAVYLPKGAVNLRLGRRFAVVAARGKGLGVTTTFRTTETNHTIIVWYDMVV